MTDLTEAQQRTASRARAIGATSVAAIILSATCALGFLLLALFVFGITGSLNWHRFARVESLAFLVFLVGLLALAFAVRIDPSSPAKERDE